MRTGPTVHWGAYHPQSSPRVTGSRNAKATGSYNLATWALQTADWYRQWGQVNGTLRDESSSWE
jgi:hypothetical protein